MMKLLKMKYWLLGKVLNLILVLVEHLSCTLSKSVLSCWLSKWSMFLNQKKMLLKSSKTSIMYWNLSKVKYLLDVDRVNYDINKNLSILLGTSFLPQVFYFDFIDCYKTLGISYFEGSCFEYFCDMNASMTKACKLSVEKLQRIRVIHGELNPFNFIISKQNRGKIIFDMILILNLIYITTLFIFSTRIQSICNRFRQRTCEYERSWSRKRISRIL